VKPNNEYKETNIFTHGSEVWHGNRRIDLQPGLKNFYN